VAQALNKHSKTIIENLRMLTTFQAKNKTDENQKSMTIVTPHTQ
jgi:hypothetical protein